MDDKLYYGKSLIFKSQLDLEDHRKEQDGSTFCFLSFMLWNCGWGPVIHSQVWKCIIWLPGAHYTNHQLPLYLIDTRIPGLLISSAALKFKNTTHAITHKIFTRACTLLLYYTAIPERFFNNLLEWREGMPILNRFLLLKHLILYFRSTWSSSQYWQFDWNHHLS